MPKAIIISATANDVRHYHQQLDILDTVIFIVTMNISTTWPMGKVYPRYRASGVLGLQQTGSSGVTDLSFSSFDADSHTYFFIAKDVRVMAKKDIFGKLDAGLQIVYKEKLYDSYNVVDSINSTNLLAMLCKSGSALWLGMCI